MGQGAENEHKEDPIVNFTHAVIDPNAVMIKFINAAITYPAMFALERTEGIAMLTVKGSCVI